MADIKDGIEKGDDYIWEWAEPGRIDGTSLIILNENLAAAMGIANSVFPVLEGKESENLNKFVRKFYQENILEIENLDLLVQNLFLLRSIDLQMRETKELLKREIMLNCAQVALTDILLLIADNPSLFAEIDNRMKY